MAATFSDWRRNLGLAGGSLWLITVGTAFAVWGLLAVRSSFAEWLLTAISIVAALLIVFGVVMVRQILRLPRGKDRRPSERRRVRRQFAATVAAEGAGCMVVSLTCVATHHFGLIAPLNLVIVGLHFLPLARLFRVPRYYVTGILFCVIPIFTLLFIPRSAHVGHVLSWFVIPPIGCGLVCLITAWAGLNEVQRFVNESRLQLRA